MCHLCYYAIVRLSVLSFVICDMEAPTLTEWLLHFRAQRYCRAEESTNLAQFHNFLVDNSPYNLYWNKGVLIMFDFQLGAALCKDIMETGASGLPSFYD